MELIHLQDYSFNYGKVHARSRHDAFAQIGLMLHEKEYFVGVLKRIHLYKLLIQLRRPNMTAELFYDAP